MPQDATPPNYFLSKVATFLAGVLEKQAVADFHRVLPADALRPLRAHGTGNFRPSDRLPPMGGKRFLTLFFRNRQRLVLEANGLIITE